MAPMRPTIPGTGWIAVHFPSFASREKAVLVIASAVFFEPIPMKEKSMIFPRTLSIATALLEMGSGKGSTPDSAATDCHPPRRSNKKDAKSFFIDNSACNQKIACEREHCQVCLTP